MNSFYSKRYISHTSIGWIICIRNYVQELDASIDFMFKMFEIKDRVSNVENLRGSFYLKHGTDDEIIKLSFEDRNITSSYNISEILGELYEAVFLPVFLERPHWWYIHGGAVSLNGKAIVFTGSTHAGKTTMISTLCTKGCLYLTDDIVPVNMESLKVQPFPHPITSRNINIMDISTISDSFEVSNIKMLGKNRLAPNGDEKFILNPKNYIPIGGELPIEAVVILKRDESFEGVKLSKFNSTDSFINLLFNARHPGDMNKNRKNAAELSKHTKVLKMNYSESVDAASYIIDLFYGREMANE